MVLIATYTLLCYVRKYFKRYIIVKVTTIVDMVVVMVNFFGRSNSFATQSVKPVANPATKPAKPATTKPTKPPKPATTKPIKPAKPATKTTAQYTDITKPTKPIKTTKPTKTPAKLIAKFIAKLWSASNFLATA